MEQTIFGLPVSSKLPDGENYSVSPYSAVAIIKSIDSDGDDVFAVVSTDMSYIEANGLLEYGKIYVTEMMRKSIKNSAKNGSS